MSNALQLLSDVAVTLLVLALLLALVRVFRGPTSADRIVAIDLASILFVGLVLAFSIAYNDPLFVDVALVAIVTSFLASLGLARYLQTRRAP